MTDVQAKGLRQLREDEKLAHDVYVALAAKWKVPLFARISQAESRHMDAVARLLNVYKLTGPVGDRGLGEFSNPEFTTLYQQLVQAGSVSLAEAYKVGARIEELDISDLRKAAAGSTQPIVRQVFGNLERASRNHLRAFASQLDAVGATYTARHLTQDQFDAIANSSWEAGHGNRRGGRGRGRGQAGPRRGGNGGGPGWGRGSGRGTGHGQFAHQGRRADFGRSPRRGAH